jgi:hypothetical protein
MGRRNGCLDARPRNTRKDSVSERIRLRMLGCFDRSSFVVNNIGQRIKSWDSMRVNRLWNCKEYFGI